MKAKNGEKIPQIALLMDFLKSGTSQLTFKERERERERERDREIARGGGGGG